MDLLFLRMDVTVKAETGTEARDFDDFEVLRFAEPFCRAIFRSLRPEDRAVTPARDDMFVCSHCEDWCNKSMLKPD